ncbi:sensor histidine kinase [Arcanobacterium canis]
MSFQLFPNEHSLSADMQISHLLTPRSISYFLIALLFGIPDLAWSATTGQNTLWLSVAIALFVLASQRTILQVVFIAYTSILVVLTFPEVPGICIFGIYTIIVDWIDSGFFLRAFSLLGIFQVSASLMLPHANAIDVVFSFIAPIILCVGLGFFLRWIHSRIHTLEEENATIVTETKTKLASLLHDTAAKDIAHIAVLVGDTLAKNDIPPHARKTLKEISTIAARASRNLRPMILDLSTARDQPLNDVLDDTRRMLSTRSITLTTRITDPKGNPLDSLSHAPHSTPITQLLTLALREEATNVLKYAPGHSHATLVIDVGDTDTSLTFTNAVAEHPHTGTTGGYGLDNLRIQVERLGGTLDYSRIRDECFALEVPNE